MGAAGGELTRMAQEPVIPRLAATVLLLRDGAHGMEVFMQVRHDEIDFASGALVFPGGRVDPGDREIAARPALCRAADGLDTAALALRVAAIRETFEESGILLVRPRGSEGLVSADRLRELEARHRASLGHGNDDAAFAGMLDQEALVAAADLLVPFAHWITPASQAKRYDTHFFLAAAPPDHVGVHDGREAVDSVWVTPDAGLAGVAAGTYKMVFPTHMNLTKLGRSRSTAAAFAAARAARIVTVQPTPERGVPGLRRLRIPAEADYGGDVFDVSLPSALPSREVS